MEIRYLYNSGFCVTDGDISLIIDYYLDSCDGEHTLANGVVDNDLLSRAGHLYVLSSHSHRDHFNRIVFEWSEKRNDIKYIFSKDIKRFAGRYKTERDIHFLRKFDEYEDDHIFVKAFGSTDYGVSFLIRLKESGKIIFHAGDLNNWHWLEEAAPEEASESQSAYLAELGDIASYLDYVDLLMFPVDPRLGRECTLGAKQFLDKIKCGMLIPMHFGERYEEIWKFEDYVRAAGVDFARITARGEAFIVEAD